MNFAALCSWYVDRGFVTQQEVQGGGIIPGKLAQWSDRVSPLRYVVCKGLKVGIDEVRDYLFSVNIKLNQLRNTDSDVNLVVPLEVIKGDHEFTDYMIRSNEG